MERRREIHAVNFHIGDWVSSTQALTPMARAAYITVWAIMVKCGGAFDYERCAFAAVTRMTKGQMMKAFEELEARDLISVNGKMIHSPHCQKEIDAAFNRCESAARNGQKGGASNREAKSMENNDSGEATAKQPLSDGLPDAKQPLSDGQAIHDPRSIVHEPQAIGHDPQVKRQPSPRRRNTIPDDDWKPSDKLTAELKSKGWTQEQIDRQTRKRVDYCRANGKAYADHDAAFRNWMSGEFQKETPFGLPAKPIPTKTLKIYGNPEDYEPPSEEDRQAALALFEENRRRKMENDARDKPAAP